MEITHKVRLYFVSIVMILAWTKLPEVTANSWVGSKYQIECTMCSACDNPCSDPSPPPPSPPPPSPPPPSTPSSSNCPPPPSPPSSSYPSYSPPPPSQSTYSYSSPPPPGGIYPAPPYRNFPAPPPPNPIVPYFPFYYYSPPPPALSSSVRLSSRSIVYTITLLLSLLYFF